MAKVIKGPGSEDMGAITPDTGFAELTRKKSAIIGKDVFEAQGEAKKIAGDAESKENQSASSPPAERRSGRKSSRKHEAEAEQMKAGAHGESFTKQGADEAAAGKCSPK